jgi:hypothetical protein
VSYKEEFPPAGEISEMFDNHPVGELVIVNQGNIASVLVVGGVAGVQVNSYVRLCGLITGRAQDEDQTRLVMLSGTEEFMTRSH